MGMKWYKWSPRRTIAECDRVADQLLTNAFGGMGIAEATQIQEGFRKIDAEIEAGRTKMPGGGIVFASERDEYVWLEEKAMELGNKLDEILDRMWTIDVNEYGPKPYDQDGDFPPEAPEGWDSA